MVFWREKQPPLEERFSKGEWLKNEPN